MPYVITEPCIGCKDGSCWQVCPVDAIHPTPEEATFHETEQLYIDPVGCIECGACEPQCPAEAIWRDSDLPAEWARYATCNRTYYEEGSAA